jgi:hypothetical protein
VDHTPQLNKENVLQNVASELTMNNLLFLLTHGVQLYTVAIQAATSP